MIHERLQHLADRLERTQRHWRERQEEARAGGASSPLVTLPTIAIAREAGCPGTTIAHEVGSRLGWPVYDYELLERIAKEMGLRVDLVESIDERRQSWLLETVNSFGLGRSATESSYVYHLAETILSLGAHGQCVIVGRGAAQILPVPTTLRVRLVAPLDARIEAYVHRYNLSRAEAARKVDETERQRRQFVKDHFRKDVTDCDQYDLLLNTARWSAGQCAGFIAQALKEFEQGKKS